MTLPRFQLNSLKVRITLLVLGIVFVAFMAMATFVKGMMQDQLLNFAGEQQRSVLRLLTSEVNRGLQERIDTLKMASVGTMAVPLDSALAVRQFLTQNGFLADVFNGGVHVWNQQGQWVADEMQPADDIAGVVADAIDVAEVLRTGKEHVGRIIVVPEPKLAAFALLVPLHNVQGNVSGVLGGVIRLDRPNFLSQITAHTYGRTGNLFLLDARQRLIFATSDASRVLEYLPAAGVNPWIDRFVQGFEGTARVVNPHGVEVLVSVQQIPLAHWYASVTLTPQEVFALIDAIKWPSRLVGLVMLLLSLSLIAWMLHRQFKPMTAALAVLDGFVRGHQPPQALPVVRPDEIGQLVGGFNRLLDILVQQQQALQSSQVFKQSVLNSVGTAIAVLDGKGRIMMSNDAWPALVPESAVGTNYLEAVQQLESGAASVPPVAPGDGIRAVLQGQLPRYYTECECSTQDKTWRSMTVTPLQGEPAHGAVVSVEDISQRVLMQEQVRALAFYDALTGLPNRRLALERLSQQLVQCRRSKTRLALMFVDLDHFKPINDELGHVTGDWLLRAVAQRLQGCLRESDTAARLGGDEFLVLLPDVQDADAALGVAEKMRIALACEFVTDQGVAMQISSSIGVALYPDHAQIDKDLMRLGDEAMYQAKKRGRNAVHLCQATSPDGLDLSAATGAVQQGAPSQVHLRWKAAFNCGHPQIDQQHKELFDLANALLDATALRHEQMDSFDTAFLQLLARVMEHFSLEESVLASAGYADVADHAKEHRALVAQAQALYAAAQADETDAAASDKLVHFLVNELVAAHMLQRDRDFFASVAEVA